jgi:cytochrome c peroxidase
MGGVPLADDQVAALGAWIDAVPTIPRSPPSDAAAVARGAVLFARDDVGCAGCHSGPRFTNNATVSVGTGRAFQVPSLVGVGARAPYMHDGCAPTLRDRFGPCGGGDSHGHTSQLGSADLDDLVAYLNSL